MKQYTEYRLVLETPDHYQSREVQDFINEEISRPAKRWVFDILDGVQETEHVKLDTDDFVMLPDTERTNAYTTSHMEVLSVNTLGNCLSSKLSRSPNKLGKLSSGICPKCQGMSLPIAINPKHMGTCSVCKWNFTLPGCRMSDTLQPRNGLTKHTLNSRCILNWLVILKNRSIRTIRDLDASHVPMLQRVKTMCIERVEKEIGVEHDEIMFYVHYHPSVYQLHIHVAYPYMQNTHRDIFRIHSLDSIISNLQLDSDYYKKASLQVALSRDSVLYSIFKS